MLSMPSKKLKSFLFSTWLRIREFFQRTAVKSHVKVVPTAEQNSISSMVCTQILNKIQKDCGHGFRSALVSYVHYRHCVSR
mmetsp:Transcript_15657/g.35860  ORF Transcript_15657/g.35860 Transcript_15657/m.35860 type:complete len:81 (-) Transcript_15657:67-309(-)